MFQAVSSTEVLHIHKCLCNWRVSSSKWFCCGLVNRSLIGQEMQPGLAWDSLSLLVKKKKKKRNAQTYLSYVQKVGPREKPPIAALPEPTLGLAQGSAPSNQGHLSCPQVIYQLTEGLRRGAGKPGQARVFSPPNSTVGFQVTKESRVSQTSVTSPGPPWQGSPPDQA